MNLEREGSEVRRGAVAKCGIRYGGGVCEGGARWLAEGILKFVERVFALGSFKGHRAA